MSSNVNRSFKFEVTLPVEHPHLLEGLDEWLRLNLISDVEVRRICWQYLTCRVILQSQTAPQKQKQVAISSTSKAIEKPKVPATPNLFPKMWRSLRAEFSVRWLLFLGMFTVIVSSGALAASQWERFNAFLQYGILFTYTLGFWGLSFWTGKQANLRLTSATLNIVTILLIPVNFWAMDSFSLWQNPINWLLVGIASIVLTGIAVLLSKTLIFGGNGPVNKLPLINILGLSYLHWGWKFSGFPLIAVYLAVIGTSFITVFQVLRGTEEEKVEERKLSERIWGKNAPAAVIIYALMLILLRAIFGFSVNITRLGLAIGICGWLISWLALREDKETRRQGKNSSPSSPSTPSLPIFRSQKIGNFLLFLGWLVTFGNNPPLQAIGVSGLGLWLFHSRLNLYGLKRDLTAFFVVGLQSVWLGWRLLPFEFTSWIVTTATQLTNSQDYPWILLSVGLFPYIIFMMVFANRLYSQNKFGLAKYSENLAFISGLTLTTISSAGLNAILNPTLRSLNLLLSTITLATVTHHKFNLNKHKIPSTPSSPSPPSTPSHLIYLTHISGILTLFSWINLFLPSLSQEIWAVICLIVMVGEWLFSFGDGIWRRSGWYIGWVLGAVSYLLLLVNLNLGTWNAVDSSWGSWGLTWLVTPVTLSVIASRGGEERKQKQVFSNLTILLAQLLTLPFQETRLIGLAVGGVVMFVNTRYLREKVSGVITVGFGLSLIAVGVWEFVSIPLSGWFIFSSGTILCLWVSRKFLQQGNELANIYAIAIDYWASMLCGCTLLSLSLHAVWIYLSPQANILPHGISTVIILVALSFRHFYESTNWTFYGIAWSVELLELYLIEIFEFGVYESTSDGSPRLIYLAIGNIGLGLITQIIGDWLQNKYDSRTLPVNWHILPLLYTGFGVLLRLNTFDSWTGLSTLAVAWIVISIGRRNVKLRPLSYLGLVGVSIAAYELLLYQFTLADGGAVGDGGILLATLATAIAYSYRLLSPWLGSYLRLSNQELKIFAHFHWGLGSVLLISVITSPVNAYGLALGTGLLLSSYAIFQGRGKNESRSQSNRGIITEAEIWVYIGLVQIAIFRHFIPPASVVGIFFQQIRPWIAGVSCIVAYVLYSLPWERWGWSKKPWQVTAYILPLFYLWETRIQIYSISLLLVAVYYIFIAKITKRFRFTYISLGLVNWVLWRWFIDLNLTDFLWYISSIGLSLLYIAQFDRGLKLPENKSYRHRLRILGSGMICGYAVIFHQSTGFIPVILSLIAIFAGLGLKIRAFLYVGTTTFLISSFYHLVIFIQYYPFLKWVVGLLVGIVLIFIAANFESRRKQLNSLLQNTNDEFQEWE